jgi:hypothetical protein
MAGEIFGTPPKPQTGKDALDEETLLPKSKKSCSNFITTGWTKNTLLNFETQIKFGGCDAVRRLFGLILG